MGRMTHDKSAKDFKDPLVQALAERTSYSPGVAVYFKELYVRCCELAGVEEDGYGLAPDGKKMWTHQWIGFAMKALRKEGLTAQNRKGHWELTQEGVERASSITGVALTATPIDVDTAPRAQAPVAKTPTTAPIVNTQVQTKERGQSLALVSQEPDAEYHRDAYIRGLAIAATPCRGNFSDRSAVCERCAIQGTCKSIMAVELAALSAVMVKEDAEVEARRKREEKERKRREEEAKRREEAGEPEPPPADVIDDLSGGSAEGKATLPAGTKAEGIVAALDSTCGHCGKTIPKHSKCMWVAGVGTFHEDCVKV